MEAIDIYDEDGYQIVSDYFDSLTEQQKKIAESEINRNRNNVYCGDIIDKYDGNYPIWVFVEIVPFGRLVAFYGFCAERYKNKAMKDNFYRLLTCKEIRNASAHSNCILNNLKARTAKHSTNIAVTSALMSIEEMNKNFRKNRMSNSRIQQIITILFVHKQMITSKGIKIRVSNELSDVVSRMNKNYDYYKSNRLISGN